MIGDEYPRNSNQMTKWTYLAIAMLALENSNADVPKTFVGGTLGGQQIFYDFQVTQQLNAKYALVGALSYLPVFDGQTNIGIQIDVSPFENWFAISPGMSTWILANKYTIYVPDIGFAGKIEMGKKWQLKIRPAVFYQTMKDFALPWVGITLSRQI